MPQSDNISHKIIDLLQAARQNKAIVEEWFEEVKRLYAGLEKDEKENFFQMIINRMEVSRDKLGPILEQLNACPSDDPACV